MPDQKKIHFLFLKLRHKSIHQHNWFKTQNNSYWDGSESSTPIQPLQIIENLNLYSTYFEALE